MIKRICQGTSISTDRCVPEQSYDSCAEAGRKRSVQLLDAMTLLTLHEISTTTIDQKFVEYQSTARTNML